MKKYLSLILALVLALCCVACGNQTQPEETTTVPPETTTNSTDATTEATEDTQDTSGDETAGAAMNYIQLSISEADGSMVSLTVFDDDMGNAYVEYIGKDEKKLANMELSVLAGVQAELEESGMLDFGGMDEYKDGDAFASMYIAYEDETCITANFGGEIPQEFRDAYAVMETYFQQVTADIPEYVPQPLIMGEVNPEAQAALEELLVASGVEPLDSYAISEIMMDDSFTAMMGLSKDEGITSGTSCGPMMSAVAFSCMVATVEDESKIDAVARDFADNVNWDRWVCVTANQALVASKDQMVLCLTANDDLYRTFADAIAASGWTVLTVLEA